MTALKRLYRLRTFPPAQAVFLFESEQWIYMESKPTYEELEQKMQELESLSDLVPELICIVGIERHFKYLNNAWENDLDC
ncbi:MAG: hypothetical protein R6U50_10400 [Desulfobacterales bacterium]